MSAPSTNPSTGRQNASVSTRPSHRPYQEYVRRQQRTCTVKPEDEIGSPRLWRQMTIGFICASCVGLIMLTVGSVFIAEAISSEYSITIMLCVMGMVCGLIILCGTAILGKLWISRKWRFAHGQQQSRHPPQQCFHTCSVINTPSQDQLAYSGHPDLPPAYETIMLSTIPGEIVTGSDGVTSMTLEVTSHQVQAVMALPPKYSEATAPIPNYGDPV